MLFIVITKLELTRGHIGILLFIEIAILELTGGHIGIIYRDGKLSISRRPYWNYAIYRYCQNRINRRPY